MRRKIFSILLSVAMVMVMMPSMAFAAGNATSENAVASIGSGDAIQYYSSLGTAINDAPDGENTTIKLLQNTNEDIVIPEGKDITLNLNKKTLTNNSSHTIYNNGTLNIKGSGTVDNLSHGKAALYNEKGATAALTSVTLNRSKEAGTFEPYSGNGNSYYTVLNHGTMTMGTGTTVNNNGGYSSAVVNGFQSKAQYPEDTPVAKMTITGGTYTSGVNTIKNDEHSDLTIQSGTFKCKYQVAVMNWDKCVINGGSFYAAQEAISNSSWTGGDCSGDMTINGGYYYGSRDDSFVGCGSGGTASNPKVTKLSYSNADVKDYIDGEESYQYSLIKSYTDINGIKKDNAKGYAVTTTAKAEINGQRYPSLSAAVDMASESDVIKLLAKSTESKLTISKTVNIDLNGNDIQSISFNNPVFKVVEGGNLTLTGLGEVSCGTGSSASALSLYGSSTDNGNRCVANIGENVTLSGKYYGAIIWQNNTASYGVELNLDGKIKGTGTSSAGIFVLGNIKETTGNVPIINLGATASVSGTTAIALNGYGELNVNGAKVEGTDTGIEVRAGKLTVNDGTITGNGTPTAVQANGSGTTTSGAGIGVAQHTTKLPVDVTVKGGTVSGHTAFNESNPQGNAAEFVNLINISIEGGTLNTINGGTAAVNSDSNRLFITNGTFSTNPTAYVASGSWAVESNGLWIVESEHKLTKTEEKAATCTEAGNNAYWTCETCKKVFSDEAGTTETTVKNQTIAALGHNPSDSYTVDRMPTCTEAGSMSKHCTRCDAKTGSISIAATGHSFGTKASLIKKSDATCTEAAQYYVQCDNCSAVSDDKAVAVGEALGHDYSTEWTVDKEANCQEEGIRSHHCTRCDAKTDEEVIPAGEHAFNEKASSVKKSDATCAEAAQYYVQCDYCDAVSDSKTVSVGEALPHSFNDKASSSIASEATCTEAAQYYVQCDVCGTASDSLTVTVGEALGHNYSEEWTVDKEATCTEAGSRSHHCTRCDAKTDVEEIAVLPHSFNEKASASKKSDATCTEAAQYYVQCDNCDAVSDSKTVSVGEALGHTIKHVPAKEPSYTEVGNKEYYECTVCGEYFEDANGNTVISDKSSVLIKEITESTTETTPEGDVVTKDTTTDIESGTVTESTTTEKNDGTTVENIVVTDKDGNTQSTTDIVTNPDGSKSEVTTDTKTETTEDGSVVKTESTVKVETDADGNKTEVTVEKENVAAADGSTSEKVVTTDKTTGTVTETVKTEATDGTKVESTVVTEEDGSKQSTTTTTNADLSKEIVENDSYYNKSFDNKVETEKKTVISSTGETITVDHKATIDTKYAGVITVNTDTDSEGNIKSASAEYTRSGNDVKSGVQAYLNGNHAKQIADVLGQDVDDVVIKANITSASGKDAFTVTANAADLTAGNKLYIVGVDRNGKKTLVNAKTYNVTKDGSVYVTMNDEANYQLVTKEEKAALVKDIKSTIAPAAATKTITKGKTSTMALKKTLNMDNVKGITYTTNNKSVATVSATGKITAKNKGTTTIKAIITLNDGSKKTVSMKIKVK